MFAAISAGKDWLLGEEGDVKCSGEGGPCDEVYKSSGSLSNDLETVEELAKTFPDAEKADAVPDVSEWKGPILLRLPTASRLKKTIWRTDDGPEVNISYNMPIEENVIHFETNMFKGKAVLRFRDCPGEPTEYFSGRKRRQQWTVQGQFKKTLNAHHVFTGYEFNRKFVDVPGQWVFMPVLSLIRTLAPTFKEDMFSEQPYFLNPFLQTVQTLDISMPGDEPDIKLNEFVENNVLFGGKFCNEVVDRLARKSYFCSEENGKNHVFDPQFVYTFDCYEDRFDPSLFNLVLPFTSISLTPYMNAQPLTLMSKVWDPESEHDGSYLFNFEMFHKTQFEKKIE